MAGTYTNLLYHIVFSTKHRQHLITPGFEEDLYRYIGGILRGLEGTCLEINGMPDHLHILAKLPPKVAVSVALRDIKANSSKWVNEFQSSVARFSWQDGYSAFTVSKSQVPGVRKYLREQKEHHQKRGYQDELLGLLEKHNVDYDPRYLWD